MNFHPTFVSSASWDKDELIRFWGQKVKCQGHSMTKNAKNSIFEGGGVSIHSSVLCIKFLSSNQWHRSTENWWLGGVTVRALDLRSSGRGFDSQSGHYQAT